MTNWQQSIHTYIYICQSSTNMHFVFFCFAVYTQRPPAIILRGRRRELNVRYAAPGTGAASAAPKPKPQEEKPCENHSKDTAGILAAKPPKRTKFLSPSPAQALEGHASGQGPIRVLNPSTAIESQVPFRAGRQAPPVHRVTRSRQGRDP